MPVQFHALAFGVMVVVAVGTIAYTLWNINKEQQQPYRNRNRNSRPSNRSDSSRSNLRLRYNDPLGPSTSGSKTENKKPQTPRIEDTCSICLMDLENDVKTLSCSHIFHNYCISTWFNMEKTCPNCRSVSTS